MTLNRFTHPAWHILFIFAVLTVAGLPSLFDPFGADQGTHALIGSGLLSGKLPYLDMWGQKGPLSYLPYTLTTALFGRNMWGIRVYEFLHQFGSGLLLWAIARRYLKPSGALLATSLYLITYYALGPSSTAHFEAFMLPLLLGAFLLYERHRPVAPNENASSRAIFIVGLILGFTPWFKQTGILYAAAIGLWIVLDASPGGLRAMVDKAVQFSAGFLLSLGLVLALIWVSGSLPAMIEIYAYTFFGYPVAGTRNLLNIAGTTSALFAAAPWVFAGGLGFVRVVWSSSEERLRWRGILLFTLFSALILFAQQRLFLYQWVPLFPMLAILATYLLSNAVDAIAEMPLLQVRSLRLITIFVIVTFTLSIFRFHWQRYEALMPLWRGEIDFQTHIEQNYTSDVKLGQAIAVANLVQERTEPDDTIFIWGMFPAVYYLSDRDNATTFPNDRPLTIPSPSQAIWQERAFDDLSSNPPALILLVTDDANVIGGYTSSSEELDLFPEFASLLATDYSLTDSYGPVDIYRYHK